MPPELGLTAVRGKGLLVAVDLEGERAPEIVSRCFEAGLLLNAPRPSTLRFVPALNVTKAQVDEMLDILTPVLERVAAGL